MSVRLELGYLVAVVLYVAGCDSNTPNDTLADLEGVWRLNATAHECLSLTRTATFVYEEFGFAQDGRPSDRLASYHRNDGTVLVYSDSIDFRTTRNVFYAWRDLAEPVIAELPIPTIVRGRMAVTDNTLTLDVLGASGILTYARLSRNPTELDRCGPRP